MPKRFTLLNNNSGSSQKLASPKGRSFWGISIGKHNSAESNDHTESPTSSLSDHQLPPNQQQGHDPEHQEHHESHHDNHHGSKLELKRFFRPNKKHSSPNGSRSPSAVPSSSSISLSRPDPFDADGVLVQKYGRLGKILGSGAGGSVRLLTRPSDGVTFAVKEFRPIRPGEQAKDYAKKCTAEFCIGSTLHHPNIIQTLDIAHENGHYFEVMEYCPIDFFAVVMSGKMTRGEINCCFRQITEGVKYLHDMGLAHRDLKLDNCVVTKDGIVKIIDFGSAVVFRYPFEDHTVRSHGVVGSDPYLAPEVITQREYDPQPVDIWSIAIIYCCMTLKRFPWKVPKTTDPSYKLYCMPDDEPHNYYKSAEQHKMLLAKRRAERLKNTNEDNEKPEDTNVEKITEVLKETTIEPSHNDNTTGNSSEKSQSSITLPINDIKNIHNNNHKRPSPPQEPKSHHRTIHGPYRLMRLLPHAARPIISRMLTVDPNRRASFKEIFQDEWFSTITSCTMNQKGEVIHSAGHHHTFIEGDAASLDSYKEAPNQAQKVH